MIDISIYDQTSLVVFWLCFTRWLGIIFQLPLFDQTGIPGIVKVLACFMISFAFFNHLEPWIRADFQIIGSEYFWVHTFFQAVVGLLMGYLVKVIMSLSISVGSVISQQIGFAAMQSFDPGFQQNTGVIERLLGWVVIILILTSGALLPMFSGAFHSFETISLVNMGKLATMPSFFVDFFISLFKASILLSTPILFTSIFISCIMGIIARIVPQMNVLMIGFVVNIGIGLFVLVIISNEFFNTAYEIYIKHLGQWFQYIR